MRSCRNGLWKLFRNSGTPTKGYYYRSPPGTPHFPKPHWLWSWHWVSDYVNSGQERALGEVYLSPPSQYAWRSGKPPAILPLPILVGSPSCISDGADRQDVAGTLTPDGINPRCYRWPPVLRGAYLGLVAGLRTLRSLGSVLGLVAGLRTPSPAGSVLGLVAGLAQIADQTGFVLGLVAGLVEEIESNGSVLGLVAGLDETPSPAGEVLGLVAGLDETPSPAGSVLGLVAGLDAGTPLYSGCPNCPDGTHERWSCVISGGTGGFAALNGHYVFGSPSACTWEIISAPSGAISGSWFHFGAGVGMFVGNGVNAIQAFGPSWDCLAPILFDNIINDGGSGGLPGTFTLYPAM